jgi:hypothetical protein
MRAARNGASKGSPEPATPGSTQALDLAKECQSARRVGIGKRCQEQPPEQAGKAPAPAAESRRFRLSQANVRSTTHRRGRMLGLDPDL